MNVYQEGKSIVSKLRAYGYNITFIFRKTWFTFYIDDEFLFCTDLQILTGQQVYEILLELLKEKSNVLIQTKNKKN